MILVSDSVMPASVVTFRASNYAQVYKTDMFVFDTIYMYSIILFLSVYKQINDNSLNLAL